MAVEEKLTQVRKNQRSIDEDAIDDLLAGLEGMGGDGAGGEDGIAGPSPSRGNRDRSLALKDQGSTIKLQGALGNLRGFRKELKAVAGKKRGG